MFYHFKIHKESDGYWAESIELAGCHTQGDTLQELHENMKIVLNLYLSEPLNSKYIFPLPLKKTPSSKLKIEKVQVDPSVAFSLLIRMTRLGQKLTLREMATRLNYKNINTYVKLEKPHLANPELKTLAKIKEKFANFPLDLIFQYE